MIFIQLYVKFLAFDGGKNHDCEIRTCLLRQTELQIINLALIEIGSVKVIGAAIKVKVGQMNMLTFSAG